MRPIEVPADIERVRALDERKPAVVGAFRKGVEEPVGSLEPAAGNRVVSAELEVVGREPGGDAAGAAASPAARYAGTPARGLEW